MRTCDRHDHNQPVESICSAGHLLTVSVDLALHPHLGSGETWCVRINVAVSLCSPILHSAGFPGLGLCKEPGTQKKARKGQFYENIQLGSVCARVFLHMHALRESWEDTLSWI